MAVDIGLEVNVIGLVMAMDINATNHIQINERHHFNNIFSCDLGGGYVDGDGWRICHGYDGDGDGFGFGDSDVDRYGNGHGLGDGDGYCNSHVDRNGDGYGNGNGCGK